jgi:CPA2 family monovalent cation:H+ antiporter-2
VHTEFTLISTLAWGLGLSLFFGYLASRIGIPALVGYLLAGICIAPTTPGFVGDLDLASQLSEVGVMLLMFGVGLHFSLKDLLRVRSTALPGAIIQMAVATTLGMGVAYSWGWNLAESFILGLSLSCASTVVLLKGLEAKGWLQTSRGQLAVGWLVVEDLVTVLLLVLLPTMASVFSGEEVSAQALTVTLLETTALIIGFVASMLLIAKRLLPWALMQTVRTGSSELFTLCVIAIAIGVAYASSIIFNVSFALGAFFAGMMMRESEYSHRAALQTLPLQDAFSVLFFLGVGMLFDPSILISQPLHVLAVVFVIVFCKSITAMIWVRFKGRSHLTALTVGVALSQVGEFSFILAGLGTTLGLLPPAGMSMILAGGIISIAINPLLFALIEPVMLKLFPSEVGGDEDETEEEEEAKTTVKRDRVLIVGAGIIGHDLFFGLRDRKIESFVIEKNIERTHQGANDEHFIYGDAATKETYEKVELERIRWMVITSTDPLASRRIAEVVSSLDEEIRIIVLVEREADIDFLKEKTGEMMEAITQVIDIRSEVARTVLGALLTSRGLRSGAPKQLPKRQQTIDAEAQEQTATANVVVPSLEHKTEKVEKAEKAEKTDKTEESTKREKAKDADKASDAKSEATKDEQPQADQKTESLEEGKDETARKSSRTKKAEVEESASEVKEEATVKASEPEKTEESEETQEPARKSRRSKKAEAEEASDVKEEAAEEDKAEASEETDEPARKSRRSKKAEAEEEASDVKEETAEAEKLETSEETEESARKSRRSKKAEAEEEASDVKEETAEAKIEETEEQEEPARKSRRGKKAEAEEDASDVKEETAEAEKIEESEEQEEPARKSRRSKKAEAEDGSDVKEEAAEAKIEETEEQEEPVRKSRRSKKAEAEDASDVKEEAAEEDKAEASEETKEPVRKSRRSKKAEAEEEASDVKEGAVEEGKAEESEETEETARKYRRSKKAEAEEEVSDAKEETARKSRRGKKAEAEEEASDVKEETAEAEKTEETEEVEEPARKSRRRSKKTDADEAAETAQESEPAEGFVTIEINEGIEPALSNRHRKE